MFFTFVSQCVLVLTYSEGSPICCVRLSLSFLLDSVLREFSISFIASLTSPLCDAVGVSFGLSFSNVFSAQGTMAGFQEEQHLGVRALRFGCFIYIRSDCLLVLMFFVVQEEAVFCSVPFALRTILDYRTQSRA